MGRPRRPGARYAARHVGPDDAQEVVAETFLVAWRRLADVPGLPLPWLLVVARNTVANHRRSHYRGAILHTELARLHQAAEVGTDAGVTALHRAQALSRLASLSPKDREALLLVSWDGLEPADAAQVAGCSLATFHVRLHRARRRLLASETTHEEGAPADPSSNIASSTTTSGQTRSPGPPHHDHHEDCPMNTGPMSPAQHPDLLSVLTAIRPDVSTDLLGPAEQQAAVRNRITGTAPTAAQGDELASRRRRPLVTLAATALVLTGGVGAAAAGGLMPQAFLDAFAGWQDFPADGGTHAVDPATAQRAATAEGPDGTVFSVVTATAADDPDYTCTVALFETAASAAQPGPAQFTEASGNGCTAQPTDDAFGSGVNVDVTDGFYVWWTPAGDAVSGDLITDSGATYPVVLVDGNLYGWFPEPAADAAGPELVGYASDGTEVGRTTI